MPVPRFDRPSRAPVRSRRISALNCTHHSGPAGAKGPPVSRQTGPTLLRKHCIDFRHVQEQLGHACLQTTQFYTHVSIRQLKEVHAATHPGAALSRPDTGLAEAGGRA